MSISSALSNALSGLTVSSRATDILSSNVANAMTDGYGTRRLEVGARVLGNAGAGAQVIGVTRMADMVLIGQRRGADSSLGAAATLAGYHGRIEQLIGTPDASGSLSAKFADFEAGLILAANGPDSQTRLTAAVTAAIEMVTAINDTADGIQGERLVADQRIGQMVVQLNDNLSRLADLNQQIRSGMGGGRDVSALLDAQQVLVDQIAPMIPLHERRDGGGQLQLYSNDGRALLDGRAAQLGFSTASVMEADMTLANGALSGLSVNGQPVPLAGAFPAFQGGALSAQFHIRDVDAVASQARLDAVALDLAARFDATGLDPTLGALDAGLFTDAGGRADGLNEVGLASRLRINIAVVADSGGDVARLRDGLGATSAGPIGDAGLLMGMIDALGASRTTQSGGFSAVGRSMAGLVSDHLSLAGLARQTAETHQGHESARHAAFRQEELAGGVDTDAEMQRLLQIEQAYAANARVIATVEQMMDQLMRLGA